MPRIDKAALGKILIALLLMPFGTAQLKSANDKVRSFGVDAHLLKISSELRGLIGRKARRQSLLRELPLALPGSDGKIEVEIWLRDSEMEGISPLAQLGLEVMAFYPQYSRVLARLDAALLGDLAALQNVVSIRHNQRPFSMGMTELFRCPSATSQADDLIGTREVRYKFGFQGDDVKIAIISDSFRTRLRGDIRQESDENGCKGIFFENSVPQTAEELPESIRLLDNGPGGGTDEGRALAELIHDLAPKADILFHTGVRDMADFAEGIRELAECGADIIIDDLLYPREPMFQAGLIQQAASQVADPDLDGPVLYLSSAGNQGDGGIHQTYKDSASDNDEAIPTTGIDFHEFPSGKPFAEINIAPGCGMQFVLQWDEPFPEKFGDPGATTDLDLYICTSTDLEDCIFGSNNGQGCSLRDSLQSSPPIEISNSIINQSGIHQAVFLAVDHYCGDPEVQFRLVTFPITGPQCPIERIRDPLVPEFEHSAFTGPQIYGHAAAREVIAVAAIDYREIKESGNFQRPLGMLNAQPYSALGGAIPVSTELCDETASQHCSPNIKPDLTAPDATNTTFFNRLKNPDRDECPNFFGTSAAVAHAAGAAVLVMEANPDLEPGQIAEILQQTATRMFDSRRSGAGLIDAFAAVYRARQLPSAPLPQAVAFSAKSGSILHWLEVNTALSYRVEVRESAIRQRVFSAQTSQSRLAVPASFVGKGFQWRVSAVNRHGQGGWSAWSGFGTPNRRLPRQ